MIEFEIITAKADEIKETLKKYANEFNCFTVCGMSTNSTTITVLFSYFSQKNEA